MAALALATLAASCQENECTTDRDCPSGNYCFRGACRPSRLPDADARDASTQDAPGGDVAPDADGLADEPGDGPGTEDAAQPEDGRDGVPACATDEDCVHESPCMTGTCVAAACRWTPKPDDLPCDDGLWCNGPEKCWDGICEIDTQPCPMGDSPCMYPDCVEDTRECVMMPVLDGAPCGGGGDDPCTTRGGACFDGSCTPSPLLPCDDRNACTIDGCRPDETGVRTLCDHEPLAPGTPCSDADPCGGTAGRTCVAGACAAAADAPCADGSLCVVTRCDAGACTVADPRPAPPTLECGTGVSAATLHAPDDVADYGTTCGAGLTGGEAVFAVPVPAGNTILEASLAGADSSGPLSLFLLDDLCAPSTCLAASHDAASVSAAVGSGRTYFLVVDGAAGARGTFSISVACR